MEDQAAGQWPRVPHARALRPLLCLRRAWIARQAHPGHGKVLKIVEKSEYQALPWVQYITQHGDDHSAREGLRADRNDVSGNSNSKPGARASRKVGCSRAVTAAFVNTAGGLYEGAPLALHKVQR
ncbi:hypothetical protein C8Q70DRAFT_1015938 [Cubamyces menziesii]|nr:hypothetical protein C8Q70DRAFT_1015938 [Cubamyces menziesii]